MNIEVGKAYMMRCGGSVRIDRATPPIDSELDLCFSDNSFWYSDGTYGSDHKSSPFDLIKEVPFAHGERVINTEGDIGNVVFIYKDNKAFIKWDEHSFGSVTISNIKLHDKKELIAEIEAEIAELQKKLQQLTGE